MISQIDDEGVMSMCLIVNDDLHKTFERYRAIKKNKQPAKFVPGESTQQTMLNPSHVYTQNSGEENKGNRDNAGSNSGNAGAGPQNAAADVDLFDLMGNSSNQAQQPQPQQPQMQMDPM